MTVNTIKPSDDSFRKEEPGREPQSKLNPVEEKTAQAAHTPLAQVALVQEKNILHIAEIKKHIPAEEFWDKLKGILQFKANYTHIEIGKLQPLERGELIRLAEMKLPIDSDKLDEFIGELSLAEIEMKDLVTPYEKRPPSDLERAVIANDREGFDKALKEKKATAEEHNLALMWASRLKHADFAKQLVLVGADVNVSCELGVSPLIYAIHYENVELVRLLLDKNADVNQATKTGETPLMVAAGGKSIEIVKLLLDKEADIEKRNDFQDTAANFAIASGNTDIILCLYVRGARFDDVHDIIKSLKHWRGRKYQSVFNRIVEQEPQLLPIYREQTLRALVSHSWKMKSSDALIPKFDSLLPTVTAPGGGLAPYFLRKIAKGVKAFSNNFPDKSPKAFHEAQYALQFAADQKARKPADILKRWKAGKPVVIATGYRTHASSIILHGDLLVLCDRGGVSRKTLEFHHFNKENMNKETLAMILSMQKQTPENYKNTLMNLSKILQFTEPADVALLEKLMKLKFQVIGNCAWESSEGALFVLLILETLKKDPVFAQKNWSSDPQKVAHITQIVEKVRDDFRDWLLFQQILSLEKYLANIAKPGWEYVPDYELIERAFATSQSFNREPELLERLKALESLYETLQKIEPKYEKAA